MREGGVILCALCLALVLLFERLGLDAGVKVAKPLASAGFLLCALGSEALASDYGLALLAALLLSWFGDVFLMFRGSQSLFKAGILSFLLGHLGFIVAFSVHRAKNHFLILSTSLNLLRIIRRA